jgi:hypothetical protein
MVRHPTGFGPARPANKAAFGKRERWRAAKAEPASSPGLEENKPDVVREAVADARKPEERRSARKRVLHRGKLCFGEDFKFTVDCVIRDISDSGARVQVDGDPTVPYTSYLVHLREHAAYETTVAWRKRGSIGLKIISRHDLETPTEEMEVLRQYCVERDLRHAPTRLSAVNSKRRHDNG